MRLVFIILFLFTSLKTIAQKDSKLNYFVSFSPGIGYRDLRFDEGEDFVIEEIVERRNDEESWQFQFGASALIDYKFRKKIHLRTGIEYSNFGEARRNIPFPWNETYPLEEFEYAKVRYNCDYIGIPLNVGWRLPIGEHYFFESELGASFLYFLTIRKFTRYKYESMAEPYKSRSNLFAAEIDNANLFNVQLNLGLGFGYKIDEKSSLQISPYFQLLTRPLFDTPIRGYYFKSGLSFTYGYSL